MRERSARVNSATSTATAMSCISAMGRVNRNTPSGNRRRNASAAQPTAASATPRRVCSHMFSHTSTAATATTRTSTTGAGTRFQAAVGRLIVRPAAAGARRAVRPAAPATRPAPGSVTRSFVRIALTWSLTVPALRWMRPPMSAFDRPSATRTRTSRSRTVSSRTRAAPRRRPLCCRGWLRSRVRDALEDSTTPPAARVRTRWASCSGSVSLRRKPAAPECSAVRMYYRSRTWSASPPPADPPSRAARAGR